MDTYWASNVERRWGGDVVKEAEQHGDGTALVTFYANAATENIHVFIMREVIDMGYDVVGVDFRNNQIQVQSPGSSALF